MNVIVGTATVALARATLAIGNEHHTRRSGDQLVLDGVDRPLRVATPDFLDLHEIKDRWSDLASDPLAQLFRDVAPGDHVTCELTGWRIEPGTRVAVAELAGQVMMIAVVTGTDDEARERVTKVMSAVRADPAMKVIGHPPVETPMPRRPWHGTVRALGGIGLTGVMLSAITWIDPRTLLDKHHGVPFALGVLVPSLVMLVLMLLLVMTRPWFAAVDTQTTPSRFRAPWSRGSLVGGILATVLVIDFSVGLMMMAIAPTIAMPIRFFAVTFIAGLALVVALRAQRPQRRLARLLRGAGVIRGTLVAPAPPLVYDVRYDREVRTHGSKGDRATIWYDGVQTADVAKPFSIESEGRRIEVSGDRIFWGAPLAYVPLTKQDDAKVVAKTHAQIEPGASVLVRGRMNDVDGVPTFQATGAESFVIYGDLDATRSLRFHLVPWYGLTAILVAIALGSAAYGVYLTTLEPIPPITAEKPL